MNLQLGLLCEDGVVVGSAESGAARAAGFDGGREPPTTTFVVGSDLILAGVGPAGMGQRFADVVTTLRSDSRFTQWTGLAIARTICAEAADDFASTRCDQGQFGALVAFAARDGFQLCRFAARDLQPELATPHRGFAAMGARQSVAYPFLDLLERVFFPGSPPKLEEGMFVAAWALDYAVGLETGRSAATAQVAVLWQDVPNMPFTARLLGAGERSDLLARVRAAEKHLAAYRRHVSGEGH